jgi:hypothetical protein
MGHLDIEYFTDGSSFVRDHMHFAGYKAVTLDSVTDALLLPVGTQRLNLSPSCRCNICTDSKYAFTTIHVHVSLYKERGLINLRGKSIKNGQEILKLLGTEWALNWWQLYTAKGTKKEMQQLLGETKSKQRGQTGSPHEGTSPKCPDSCLVPMSLS